MVTRDCVDEYYIDKRLFELDRDLNHLILAVPTSALRNKLTEVNMLLMEAQTLRDAEKKERNKS